MSDEPFPGRNRRSGAPGNSRHRGYILGRTWLLDEEKLQRLDFLHDDRRHARARLRVEIDADVNVRTDTFAQHLQPANGSIDLLVRFDPLVIARYAGFKAGDAQLPSRFAYA